ncbi:MULTISPECIES: hypothetical protein [unclassified Pseudomonas]|uniref:hypothetical protein n=1 Tax=unclassified Pseudomonas TaxID=196821 RepID=UPI00159F8B3A|nr:MULTISPECIES: hypothetical protein [unclassified Pseudomonas]NWC91601.1 hypothetical protein [Pseudomonas sp. IPO3779]NWD17973.1 hypothetical protein [Pseudomonas sp. IPO3778]
MDDNGIKGIGPGVSLTIRPLLPRDSAGAAPEVPVTGKDEKDRTIRPRVPGATSVAGPGSVLGDKGHESVSTPLVFGSLGGGAIVDKSTHQGGLAFGADNHAGPGVDPGPRFDIPGPMMRTVRDPALSLVALSGVEPDGQVMVEIPPVADAGYLRSTPSLSGSRIGFASEYRCGDVRETVEHRVAFAQVLNRLRTAGAQLVPVQALLVDDSQYFSLLQSNEIDDRVAEHQLDALISDAHTPAFHHASTTGNPRFCLLAGTDVEGASLSVWFYGAQWAGDRLAALVHSSRQVLLAGMRSPDGPTSGRE